MGQRLVLTIKKDNEPVFNIYYHWLAYTQSAILEAKAIYDVLRTCDQNDKKAMIRAVALYLLNTNDEEFIKMVDAIYNKEGELTSCHGGLKPDSFQAFINDNPDLDTIDFKMMNDDRNRNEGIMSITKKDMEEMASYSEGDIVIDLDADEIYNNVFGGCWESLEDMNKEYERLGLCPVKTEEVLDSPADLEIISLDKLDKAADFVALKNIISYAKSPEGTIYEFVA